MTSFWMSCLITASLASSVVAESVSSLRAVVRHQFAVFNDVSITSRLDDTGGVVIAGYFEEQTGLANPTWLILWDVEADELEVRKDGAKIADLDQFTFTTSIDFEGAFIAGIPQLVGSIVVDAADHLFIEISDTDGGFSIELDENGDAVFASRCLCTTANGGQRTATCTNLQCDNLIDCSGGQTSRFCNRRATEFISTILE